MLRLRSVIYAGLRIVSAVVATSVVTTVFTGVLVLTTETGRIGLSQFAIEQVNGRGEWHVRLDNLRSPSLGEWAGERLLIEHNGASWLTLNNFQLRWQPRELWSKNLLINEFQARELSLFKVDNNREADSENDSEAMQMPLLAIEFQKVALEKISLADFLDDNLEPPLPDLRLSGDLHWRHDQPLQVNLDLLALASTGGEGQISSLSLHSTAQSANKVLLKGHLQERAEGPVGQWLHLPSQQVIDAGFVLDVTLNQDPAGEAQISINIDQLTLPISRHNLAVTGEVVIAHDLKTLALNKINVVVDNSLPQSVNGAWRNGQLDFALALQQFPLDALSPFNLPLNSGDVSAQLTLSGTLEQPLVVGQLRAQSAYDSQPLAVDLDGSLSARELFFKTLSVGYGDAQFEASGKIALQGNTSALSLRAKNIQLESLRPFELPIPPELSGKINHLEAQISGAIKNPEGQIRLSLQGDFDDYGFQVAAALTKKGERLQIEHLQLDTGKGAASATGTISLPTLQADLALKLNTFSLSLLGAAGVSMPDNLAALATGDIKITGHLKKPRVDGTINIDGQYQDIPFAMVAELAASKQKSTLKKLELSAFGQQVLTLSGSYIPAVAKRPPVLDVWLRAEQLPTKLFASLGWDSNDAALSGELHFFGSVERPVLTGDLRYSTVVSALDDQGEQRVYPVSWQLQMTTENNQLAIASLFQRDDNHPGALNVHIPLQPYIDYFASTSLAPSSELPLLASVEGVFDLQTLSFFLDQDLQRISGIVHSDLQLSGSLKDPVIDGSIRLANGHYENALNGTVIDNINCAVVTQRSTLQSSVFAFNSCRAGDGGAGTYVVSGDIALPANGTAGAVNLNLNTDHVVVLKRPDIDSEVTGTVSVQGDFTHLVASGQLDISPLTAVLDASFVSNRPSIEVEEVFPQTAADAGSALKRWPMPTIQLDLVIAATQKAYLRGHGLETQLKGQIAIKGTPQALDYQGRFTTVRGVFELFGKKFKLKNGQVSFANNAIAMTVSGVYKKAGQQINVDINGRDDAITLALSAVPPLPEDEIIAFIIFGKTLQNITPFEAVQLAAAVQTLRTGGAGFFDPVGGTREILGVDTLTIDTEKDVNGDTGVNLGVGKYLNEKVYLELERTPNPSQPWRGNITIELTPTLTLESSTGGASGIEGFQLKWKRDY